MNKIFTLILICISLTACNNNTSSSTISLSNNYSLNYNTFKDLNIELNNMYNIDKDKYAIYFYSEYCPICYTLKDDLFKYLQSNNKSIPDFYLLNIDEVDEEEFNKMPWANRMSDEEILKRTLYATSIEETFFKSAPSIYIIENINNTKTLTNALLSYDTIKDFLITI